MNSTKKLICWTLLLLHVPLLAQVRVWTDSEGRKVSGELLAVNGNMISLKVNGQVFPLPLERLSAADREFVKNWKAPATQPPVAEAPAGEGERFVFTAPEKNYATTLLFADAASRRRPTVLYGGNKGGELLLTADHQLRGTFTVEAHKYNEVTADADNMALGEWVVLEKAQRPVVRVEVRNVFSSQLTNDSKKNLQISAQVEGVLHAGSRKIPFTGTATMYRSRKQKEAGQIQLQIKFNVESAALGLRAHPDPQIAFDLRVVGFLKE